MSCGYVSACGDGASAGSLDHKLCFDAEVDQVAAPPLSMLLSGMWRLVGASLLTTGEFTRSNCHVQCKCAFFHQIRVVSICNAEAVGTYLSVDRTFTLLTRRPFVVLDIYFSIAAFVSRPN
jgi:hypothetical protein